MSTKKRGGHQFRGLTADHLQMRRSIFRLNVFPTESECTKKTKKKQQPQAAWNKQALPVTDVAFHYVWMLTAVKLFPLAVKKQTNKTKQRSRNCVSDEFLSEKRLSCDWRRVPSDPSRPRLGIRVRAVRWTSSRDVSCEIKWLTHSNVLSPLIVAIVPQPAEKKNLSPQTE